MSGQSVLNLFRRGGIAIACHHGAQPENHQLNRAGVAGERAGGGGAALGLRGRGLRDLVDLGNGLGNLGDPAGLLPAAQVHLLHQRSYLFRILGDASDSRRHLVHLRRYRKEIWPQMNTDERR